MGGVDEEWSGWTTPTPTLRRPGHAPEGPPRTAEAIVEQTAAGLPGHRAVEWLRALSESFQLADVPKEKADLMHASWFV